MTNCSAERLSELREEAQIIRARVGKSTRNARKALERIRFRMYVAEGISPKVARRMAIIGSPTRR